MTSIFVTENHVVHLRKPRSVETVEYVQVSELAEAVGYLKFFAPYIEDLDTGDLRVTFDKKARGLRYFLAKIER
jgi:hypothetical protein